MFLRNWDNFILLNNFYPDTISSQFGDQSLNFKDWTSQLIQGSLNYKGLGEKSNYMYIFIGGEGAEFASTHSDIDENQVNYDDFDLSKRFTITTTDQGTNSNTIYGQSLVYGTATYDKDKKKWYRTITREFKNNYSTSITVKEIGLFTSHNTNSTICLAREVLESPVKVEPEAYFKATFTYECDNPYPHKTEYISTLYEDPYRLTISDNSVAISHKYFLIICRNEISNLDTLVTEGKITYSIINNQNRRYCYCIKNLTDQNISFTVSSSDSNYIVCLPFTENILSVENNLENPIPSIVGLTSKTSITHIAEENECYLFLFDVSSSTAYLFRTSEIAPKSCLQPEVGQSAVYNGFYNVGAAFFFFDNNDPSNISDKQFSFAWGNYLGTSSQVTVLRLKFTTKDNQPIFTRTPIAEGSNNV